MTQDAGQIDPQDQSHNRTVAGGSNGSDAGRADTARGHAGGVTPIPASIVVARSKIMATVEAVKKSSFNEHGRYKFASTDDIYAVLARKMGEVQLNCDALEVLCEIKRFDKPAKEKGQFVRDKDGNIVTETVQWAHIVYQFVWSTPDDTWTDPNAKRTLFIQVTGAQTFQAAQSFAEKAYLRSSFKIPSGDMDLDSMPQAETEEDQNDLLAPRKRKSSAAAKRDGTDVAFNELRGAISGADGPADLALIKRNNWSVWDTLPPAWRKIVDAEFEDKMAEFEVTEAAE